MENWDDLRIFLVTARTGSSRASARQLGINQSTVSRRIRQLEERSAARLFDRRPSGLVLTEAGEELLVLATEVESRVDDVDRRLQGRDVELRGTVRLSMPDMMVQPVAPHLARFAVACPAIDVEVIVDNALVSLSHREADLVLRLSTNPPSQLVGRRIAPLRVAIYGSATATAGLSLPLDPSGVDWVRWDEVWRVLPTEAWIDAHVAPEQVRACINTSFAHTELLAAGIGVGIAPCMISDADPRLRRLCPPMDFGLVLWLLTHSDLMHTGRVRALLRFLGDALSQDRDAYIGAES